MFDQTWPLCPCQTWPQAQNLDLSNVTPVKIFELMFQSPENSVSQDDGHQNGKSFFFFFSLRMVFGSNALWTSCSRQPCWTLQPGDDRSLVSHLLYRGSHLLILLLPHSCWNGGVVPPLRPLFLFDLRLGECHHCCQLRSAFPAGHQRASSSLGPNGQPSALPALHGTSGHIPTAWWCGPAHRSATPTAAAHLGASVSSSGLGADHHRTRLCCCCCVCGCTDNRRRSGGRGSACASGQ